MPFLFPHFNIIKIVSNIELSYPAGLFINLGNLRN